MNTHESISSKQWLSLNKLRKEARGKLISRNHRLLERSLNKSLSNEIAQTVLSAFDATSKHIKNRRIDLLDESISDFIVDHISNPDSHTSAYVDSMMEFYDSVTQYRL